LKRFIFLLFLAALPFTWAAAQGDAPVRVAISGVNPSAFPRVIVTVNVTDAQGQPLLGLGAGDFRIGGTFGAQAALTEVVNVSDDNLPIAAVLAIDVSDSMAGTPLTRAKDAALAFIDALRPEDQVAVVVYGSLAQVVQDYTTDRDRLRAVIDALQPVGRTALYQGAYEAVLLAAASPLPRRAVILLGDGAEFGGRSRVGREAALGEAIRRGVPVYTIGLGFGADRSYLEELSNGTNAQFFESPTPEALLDIYRGLAARFRSQYVLTLDAFIPGDGTIYTLEVEAFTVQGSGGTQASFRAPINTPIIRFVGVPPLPITQPTTIMVDVLADQALEAITLDVPDGQGAQGTPTETPFAIEIDPLRLMPGVQIFTVTVRDVDGDVGTSSFSITVDAAIGLTQTETARPTATLTPSATTTFTPSPTFTPSATATLTPSPTFTPSLTPTATQTPTITPDLRATAESLAVTQTSVAVVATAAQVATDEARQAVIGTQVAATQGAGTRIAQATAAMGATIAQATQAQATQAALSSQFATEAAGTQAAETLIAVATQDAITQQLQTQAAATQAEQTRVAQAATATSAQATQVQATANTVATATSAQATQAQATANTVATATSAQATQIQATANTVATATSAQITQVVVETQAAITATAATQAALQTQAVATDLAEGATARAQEVAEETAVVLLATDAANASATAAVQTQAASALATASAGTLTANLAATAVVETQIAEAQATAAAATALAQTQIANATNAAIVMATQAAEGTQFAATQVAVATGTAQAEQLTATAQAFATQTAAAQATDAQATARILTLTPPPTPVLIEAQADNPPSIGDLLPLLCIIGVVSGALGVMFILLSRNRRRRRTR
jgi:VWFA-related protein